MKRCAPTRTPQMLATLALCALSACANLPPLEALMTPESTAARAERVFRYQSRIADSLLDRYPMGEDFARADPRLQSAEATMNDRCGMLTRAVLADVADEQLSWSDKRAVMESLRPCERAARARRTDSATRSTAAGLGWGLIPYHARCASQHWASSRRCHIPPQADSRLYFARRRAARRRPIQAARGLP